MSSVVSVLRSTSLSPSQYLLYLLSYLLYLSSFSPLFSSASTLPDPPEFLLIHLGRLVSDL